MKSENLILATLAASFVCVSSQAQTIPNYYSGTNVKLSPNETVSSLTEKASMVRPAARQLRHQSYGTLGFIHFNLNTFTGMEWGSGHEDLKIFNPKQLDAEQWVRTFKSAGVKTVILVAKHHDGLRLWPSKHHPRNISKTPFRNGKGDLVAEVAKACRKHNLRLSLYYSPWDKQKPYGTPAYNDLMVAELKELLTNYGWIDLIWFDGAGIDAKVSGKNMDFDWPRIYKTIRTIQPQTIISGAAPDIRWVGNEGGHGRQTEWSVQGIHLPEKDFTGHLSKVPLQAKKLGGISYLKKTKPQQLAWYPARGGMPMRHQWFWHPKQKSRTLKYMVNSYFETIGSNSGLLINLSPDNRGLIPDNDVALMQAFGDWRRQLKASDCTSGTLAKADKTRKGGYHANYLFDDDLRTGWVAPKGVNTATIELKLPEANSFDLIHLQEMIADFGQRIESFEVDAYINGEWKTIGKASTIGMRRLLKVKRSHTDRLRIRITASRLSPSLAKVSLMTVPKVLEPNTKQSEPKMISREIWKAPAQVLDGKLETHWTAAVAKGKPAHLTIDMGKSQLISAIIYTPPGGSPSAKGRIKTYAIYASNDGKSWSSKPIAKGAFGNIDNNPIDQRINLPKGTHARFFRLTALEATRMQKIVKVAEIKALK